ncbi:MAG: sigma-54 dependent transcriptional regulator [Fibrobacterota bacterium]
MPKYRILIADDEKNIRSGIRASLDTNTFDIDEAEDGKSALDLFMAREHHIVITDLKMPRMDGLELLEQIKAVKAQTLVFVISAFGDIEKAVKAIKLGAHDFIAKPFSCDEIEIKIGKAIEHFDLKKEIRSLQNELEEEYRLIGESSPMKELKETIQKVGESDCRVLISGENGTGKELVARAIQAAGPRRDRAFIKVNCAAIPKTLVENELFGSERGAYTGALERKTGKFEQADHGTLFLDEIGDMELEIQSKILRALETGEITRVGGHHPIHVDVRVIAATNKDLTDEIRGGRFREDLFFRLNVVPIPVPPLRERPGDIPLLVKYYAEKFNAKGMAVEEEAMALLVQYGWPGNVRELKNLIERFIIIHGSARLSMKDLKKHLLPVSPSLPGASRGAPLPASMESEENPTLRNAREQFEKSFIQDALLRNQWNMTKTAEQIGLQRPYLYSKMQELGIKKA